jgi:hypothetical protein
VNEVDRADRRYVYLVKTLDAAQLNTTEFVAAMRVAALPTWHTLRDRGLVHSVQVLRKIGDIDLQTSASPTRDWAYCAIVELGQGASPDEVLAAEATGGIESGALARLGIEYLSNELCVRPQGAGTAIPRPSPRWPTPPPHHDLAIEYIQIPQQRWQDYHLFMKQVMGPVGASLVETGNSHQIRILECERVLHHATSLPAWNRIHILEGDFADSRAGFFARTNEAIRALLGPEYDIESALARVNEYRIKPRMSRNRPIEALSITSRGSSRA